MKFEFSLCKPDELEATMEITMTVKEWRKLKNLIANDYPGYSFSQQISELIYEAEKHFYKVKVGGPLDEKGKAD